MTVTVEDAASGISVDVTSRNGRAAWFCFTVGVGDKPRKPVNHEGLEEAMKLLLTGRRHFAGCKIEDGKLHVLFADNYASRRAREHGHETTIFVAKRLIRKAIRKYLEEQARHQHEDNRVIVLDGVPSQRQPLSLSPQGATI